MMTMMMMMMLMIMMTAIVISVLSSALLPTPRAAKHTTQHRMWAWKESVATIIYLRIPSRGVVESTVATHALEETETCISFRLAACKHLSLRFHTAILRIVASDSFCRQPDPYIRPLTCATNWWSRHGNMPAQVNSHLIDPRQPSPRSTRLHRRSGLCRADHLSR